MRFRPPCGWGHAPLKHLYPNPGAVRRGGNQAVGKGHFLGGQRTVQGRPRVQPLMGLRVSGGARRNMYTMDRTPAWVRLRTSGTPSMRRRWCSWDWAGPWYHRSPCATESNKQLPAPAFGWAVHIRCK